MAVLARLWFVLPPEPGRDPSEAVERLVERPLAALAHAADGPSVGLAARLASAGAPAPRALALAGPSALDALAAEHADLEFAVVAGRELLLAAVAQALGLRAPPALPSPGSLSAFHWPTGRDAGARAELIGLDLDWFPPWASGQARSRFPGGPGVAGTAR